jgi:hypothetical protein
MPFVCEHCEYSTSKKGNLEKHFTTNKHKEAIKHIEKHNDEIKTIKPSKNTFMCKDCGKEHTTSQALYYHKTKSCELSERATVYKLKKKNDKLKTMMINNCNNNITNNSNNSNSNNDNSNNTTNNNNITNHIVIQLNGYDKTDTSYLTDQNHINIMCNVVNFLSLVHANPDKPENMNLLLTNLQDTHMKVYENNGWNRVKKNEQMEKLITNSYKLVADWMIEHEKRLSPSVIKQWTKFYENVVECDDRRETAKNDLATELYNSRKLIIDNKTGIEDRELINIKKINKIKKI